MLKIGLLASNSLSKFRFSTLHPILEDDSFLIKVAIIDGRQKKTLKQKLKKNIKRGRGGYILIMALQRIFSKKGKSINTTEFCKKNGIDIIETRNPYSPATLEQLKKFSLDVLILVGEYGIVKEPLLKATPLGILSYHHGNMRKYRGMPPGLWELYNNEKEMGVTVQILAPGLDNGIPIVEKTIEIRKKDSLHSLQNRAFNQSVNMLYTALKNVSNKEFTPQKIENFGKVYTLPNLKQWIILNLKLMWRRLN